MASADIYDSGLVGDLVYGVLDAGSDVVCSFGPHFLDVMLTDNNCPSNSLSPNAFKTKQKLCEYFNQCPLHLKNCLNDTAARILVDLHGITGIVAPLGTCCTHYSGK